MAAPTLPYPSSRATPAHRWPGGVGIAALTGLYWAYILISRRMEIPGFTRFMSEMMVGAVWIPAALIWWLTRRRVSWKDRLGVLGIVAAAGAATYFLKDKSVVGFFMFMLGLPVVLTAWTVWLVASVRLQPGARRVGSFAAIALGWSFLLWIRIDGLTGSGGIDMHWRWTPTAEDLYLAQHQPSAAPATRPSLAAGDLPDVPAPTDWPDFRGVDHEGVVHDLKIETDWKAHPPTKVWQQRIGPAWSSMIVVGRRLFTQEQRGENEAVVCLDAQSGQEIWSRVDAGRFSDSQAGVGPRATPVYDHDRIYTVGGRGLVNCLDAKTGDVIWRHDLLTDSKNDVPIWGYSSTPLVMDGRVIVCDIRKDGKGVVALDAKSGSEAWAVPAGQMGYASAQRGELGGKEQILILSDVGIQGLNPMDGSVLWKHESKASGPRSVQPHAVSSHQVLLSEGLDLGMTLLDVSPAGNAWSVQPAWSTKRLKPSFNDVVVDNGHIYGLDGSTLACIDVATGKPAWREGNYGRGQLLLLAEQHLLLISSDGGDIALVAADPTVYRQWGRISAIEGKTWNHPAVAHGCVYIRNAAAIACYRLPEMK